MSAERVQVMVADEVSGMLASLVVDVHRGHQGHGVVRVLVVEGEWMDSGVELTPDEKRRLSPNADWEARHY